MDGFIKTFVIVMVAVLFSGCSFYQSEPGIPKYNDILVEKATIIVDSIQINKNQSAYWFCFDLGIRGYSTGRVGIVKSRADLINDKSWIAISDEITSIKKSEDTLIIYIRDGYNTDDVVINDSIINVKILLGGSDKDLISNRMKVGFQPDLTGLDSVP